MHNRTAIVDANLVNLILGLWEVDPSNLLNDYNNIIFIQDSKTYTLNLKSVEDFEYTS